MVVTAADGSDNPDFELNKAEFSGAKILVVGDNFGCGSSREHAPWAIADYGFNTIISTSYADIFYNNCFKNSILPIIVSRQELDNLMTEIINNEGVKFVVDLYQHCCIDGSQQCRYRSNHPKTVFKKSGAFRFLRH